MREWQINRLSAGPGFEPHTVIPAATAATQPRASAKVSDGGRQGAFADWMAAATVSPTVHARLSSVVRTGTLVRLGGKLTQMRAVMHHVLQEAACCTRSRMLLTHDGPCAHACSQCHFTTTVAAALEPAKSTVSAMVCGLKPAELCCRHSLYACGIGRRKVARASTEPTTTPVASVVSVEQ